MIWMTWRLQRSVYIVFVVAVAVLIVFAVLNGLGTQSALHLWNAAPCRGGFNFLPKYQTHCVALFQRYQTSFSLDRYIAFVGAILTAVLGLLLGVNVVAGEVDRKTARAAWTQSISRTRWLATKLVISLAMVVSLGIAIGLTYDWWIGASGHTRVTPQVFSTAGVMPTAIGIFALALGTVVGILVRRPGWALAGALVILAVGAWVMQNEVRSTLVPLRSVTLAEKVVTKGPASTTILEGEAPKYSWILFQGSELLHWGNRLLTAGEATKIQDQLGLCGQSSASATIVPECEKKLGLRIVNLYVADNQFWTLQLREGGLYFASSLLLFGASLALLRRMRV
jgi:hypothetical protein